MLMIDSMNKRSKHQNLFILIGLLFGLFIATDPMQHDFSHEIQQNDCLVCKNYVAKVCEEAIQISQTHIYAFLDFFSESIFDLKLSQYYLTRAPPKI